MIVYHWTGTAMTTLSGTSNMNEGSGALSWLGGGFFGDGRFEIAQPWDNGGRLGIIIYRYIA